VDFKRPWKRYDMMETLEEKLGVRLPAGDTLHTDETNKVLRELCIKAGSLLRAPASAHVLTSLSQHHIECSEPRTNARLLDKVRPPTLSPIVI
jgi:lysyl-tRNA synthetase class 2